MLKMLVSLISLKAHQAVFLQPEYMVIEDTPLPEDLTADQINVNLLDESKPMRWVDYVDAFTKYPEVNEHVLTTVATSPSNASSYKSS